MLNLFRRHLRNCRHRPKGRHHRACSCPLSVEVTLRGTLIRKSLDIRSWEAGQALLRKWEAEGVGAELVTIPGAVAQFTADAKARHLTDATLAKYRVLLTDLEKFGKDRDIKFVRSLTIQDVREFHAPAQPARVPHRDKALHAPAPRDHARGFRRLRMGEIIALRWQDVDFDDLWIHICPRRDWTPKTAASARSIPITEDLQRYLSEVDEHKRSAVRGLRFGGA